MRGRNGRPESFASKVALARALSRPPKKGGSSLPLILTLMVVFVVLVIATSGVVGAGAAVASIDVLSQDLPDVSSFETLKFAEPTTVYDRTGTIALASFQAQQRNVVQFSDIPQLVLDATTATEDHSFWTNPGYDIGATLNAVLQCLTSSCDRGGASTITQQFVRAPEVGLLPADMLVPTADQKIRKAKEILQAARLTDYVTKTFGEEGGKEQIITAYLNQIFYGDNAYGIDAAAQVYFGESLDQLTVAQAATLAAIPQSPTCYDLYNWVPTDASGEMLRDANGQLSIPLDDSALTIPSGCDPTPGHTILDRRNYIISELGPQAGAPQGFGRWTVLTLDQVAAAQAEPIILADQKPVVWQAPQFVWKVKGELDSLLADRAPAETGGYKVITTLDMTAQTIAERYVTAATILPQLSAADRQKAYQQGKFLTTDRSWINYLTPFDIENGAMNVIDYRTGDILAYVGSAGYYRDDLATKKFDPKFDVASGYRQPGSAFKPIMYATGFDNHDVTPGTVLLDVTTPFASSWDPKDAENTELGPILVRKALQYSLNIPAIRAMDRIGPAEVQAAAGRAGMSFLSKNAIVDAGLASAIGTVEVRLTDMVTTYGAFGDGGAVNPARTILSVTDSSGNAVYSAPGVTGAGQGVTTATREQQDPAAKQVWSPQAAWLIANILEGNTDKSVNDAWAYYLSLDNGPGGEHRPVALKTGTTNDAKDVTTFGLLPQPKDPNAPAIAVGVWMGNSDSTPPRPTSPSHQLLGIDGPARVFTSFMRDYTNAEKTPVVDFQRPSKGLTQVTIDAWSGGVPGPWTQNTTQEWFITGTEPGSKNAVDPPGILYKQACGGQWYVDPIQAENADAPATWKAAVLDWTNRARSGAGVSSARFGTKTAYWNRVVGYSFVTGTWGGPIIPADPVGCSSPSPSPTGSGGPTPVPTATPKATPTPRPTPTDSGGPTPTPTRTPRPTPTDQPTPTPTRTPHPTPTDTPTPTPTRTPRPTPTDTPTPAPGATGGNLQQPSATSYSPTSAVPPADPGPSRGAMAFMGQPTVMPDPSDIRPRRLGRRRRPRRRRPSSAGNERS